MLGITRIVWAFLAGFSLLAMTLPFTVQAEIAEAIEAKVNDEIIFSGEIDEAMLFRTVGRPINELNADQYERLRWDVLREMIRDRLVVQECKRLVKQMGVDQDIIKNEIENLFHRELENYNSQFKTEELRKADMERQGFTEETLHQYLRERAETAYYNYNAAPSFIRDRIKPVTEEEIEQFKKEHPDLVKELEWIDVRHILIRCPEGSREDAEENAKGRADQVLLRLKAGENFTDLAAQLSEHESSKNSSGRLGRIKRTEFSEANKEFLDALFQAPLMEAVGPIRSDLGYHVCVVTARKTLREILEQKHVDDAKSEWVEEIRKRPEVHLYVKGSGPGGVDIPMTRPAPANP